ncbi:aldose 1-epimerase [Oxalobacteraceae bacterium GrIS 2.11]
MEDRQFSLRNAQNMTVTVSERGAALLSWQAPDRDGQMADVLLGYPDAQSYVTNKDFFGAVVGRWANRIKHGRFMLDGKTQQVTTNDRGNHLHGGPSGFFQAHWQASETAQGLTLTLTSPDGDNGFQGNLKVSVHYQLDDDGSLTIRYEAESDAPTAINLTSHPYFNLNGSSADIGQHLLQIHADHFMRIDDSGIAVAVASVAGSAFDFRQPAPIGEHLAMADPQLQLAGGFDHFYCARLPGEANIHTLRELARVVDPVSGRRLIVASTEAGLQFYSGNSLAGVPGRHGKPYQKHDGFCLEAHASPDQINGPYAQDVILRPGQIYRQTTVYQLGIEN